MKVLSVFPPNYREINRAFNIRGKPVIFCFGDTIYNPSHIKVTPQLFAHEGVHSQQQGSGPNDWWGRYIKDTTFRLHQEIAAHRAEYLAKGDLDQIARRLSSPLYGSMISYDEAMKLVGRVH